MNQFSEMTSQGKYSTANGSRLSRRTLSAIFGRKNARPNNECWELENFVRDTLAGSDEPLASGEFYIQGPGDLYEFNLRCGIHDVIWQKWFAERETGWPVVEKQNDAYVWAWFKSNTQLGAWVPLGEDCIIEREDMMNEQNQTPIAENFKRWLSNKLQSVE